MIRKRIKFCLLLLIIFSLFGCGKDTGNQVGQSENPENDLTEIASSAVSEPVSETEADTTVETESVALVNRGLVPIQGIQEERYDIVAQIMKDSTLVLLIAYFPAEAERGRYVFYAVDMESCTVTKRADVTEYLLENGINGMTWEAMTRDGDSLVVYDIYLEKGVWFDEDFVWMKEDTYKAEDQRTLYVENPFFDDYFAVYDYCARYYYGYSQYEPFDCVLLPSDPKHFYLNPDGTHGVEAGSGNSLLGVKYKNRTSTFSVYDMENAVKINTVTFSGKAEESFYTQTNCVMNDKYVFMNMCGIAEGENYEMCPLIWSYREGAVNEAVEIERFSEKGLQKRIGELKKTFEKQWHITVRIDEDPYKHNISEIGAYKDHFKKFNVSRENAGISNEICKSLSGTDPAQEDHAEFGAAPLHVCRILTEMEKFLSYFPGRLFDEIYESYEYSSGMDMYIVKNIVGDASAFASIWDHRPFIAFATEEFNETQMPHEWMHILDHRIYRTYEDQGKNFWDEWENYNPEGFYYGVADSELDETNEQYFVDWYAMTSQQEDRAEIFQRLFDCGEDDTRPFWLEEHPEIMKKTVALCKVLREIYPSLNEPVRQYWEKWVE